MLAQRLGLRQPLQLGNGVDRVGSGDRGLAPALSSGMSELDQARPFRFGRGPVGDLHQRLPSPQCQHARPHLEPAGARRLVHKAVPRLPKMLNGVAVINEVFADRGISLPLAAQATVAEHERFERGRAIQHPLYGDAIRDNLAALPEDLRGAVPRLLTEFCFGDFYTRSGLDIARRELLVLCLLAALGGADVQLRGHAAGNLKAGNSVRLQTAAMIHCLPYIGFPRALNAIRAINQLSSPE